MAWNILNLEIPPPHFFWIGDIFFFASEARDGSSFLNKVMFFDDKIRVGRWDVPGPFSRGLSTSWTSVAMFVWRCQATNPRCWSNCLEHPGLKFGTLPWQQKDGFLEGFWGIRCSPPKKSSIFLTMFDYHVLHSWFVSQVRWKPGTPSCLSLDKESKACQSCKR